MPSLPVRLRFISTNGIHMFTVREFWFDVPPCAGDCVCFRLPGLDDYFTLRVNSISHVDSPRGEPNSWVQCEDRLFEPPGESDAMVALFQKAYMDRVTDLEFIGEKR